MYNKSLAFSYFLSQQLSAIQPILRPCLASLVSFLSLLSFSQLLASPLRLLLCPEHRVIMGDSEKTFSPPTHPVTMRRERREAKRRMFLFSLLASFFFLTLVAFRRSNSFIADYTHQSTNANASVPKQNPKGKSWFDGRSKSSGPILSNSGRRLSASSLVDLQNASIGVRENGVGRNEDLPLTTPLPIVRKGLRAQYAVAN